MDHDSGRTYKVLSQLSGSKHLRSIQKQVWYSVSGWITSNLSKKPLQVNNNMYSLGNNLRFESEIG
jgi:hypothetical protein